MSGNPHLPSGRSPYDLNQAAFPAAPASIPFTGQAPSRPPVRQDLRRPAPQAAPLVSHLELGPLDGSVPTARKHADAVMREWGFDEQFRDVAGLLIAELTTNAVHASRALKLLLPSPFHLWLKAGFQRVTVTVWDANPQLPVLQQEVPTTAENGRGLMLVDFFSEGWSWYEPEGIGGKTVWCEITVESAAREP